MTCDSHFEYILMLKSLRDSPVTSYLKLSNKKENNTEKLEKKKTELFKSIPGLKCKKQYTQSKAQHLIRTHYRAEVSTKLLEN